MEFKDMETKDILLYETGDGGDFEIIADDLVMAETLYQQVYLALFGGNVEANTDSSDLVTEEKNDYWGNLLFWSETPSEQFNSNTERTLNTMALNSQGRLTILRAVESDLQYLSGVLNYSVDVELLTANRVRIIVNFTQRTNQQDRVLQLVYDNARNEIIIERII